MIVQRVLAVTCFLLVAVFPVLLSAQTEEELDELLLGDGAVEEDGSGKNTGALFGDEPFTLSGYGAVEFDGSLDEKPFGDNRVYTSRARIKLKPEYEIEGLRAYADIDYFATADTGEAVREPNTIEADEAYVEGGDLLSWKVGKQRFNWGVGDTFQPTNQIDRADYRETFVRENDDRYTGVYAFSAKFVAGDYGVEAAVRPVTERPLAPAGFYEPETADISTPAGTIVPRFVDGEMINSYSDVSFGIRGGGITGVFDWHLLFYSGMSGQIIYRSSLVARSGSLYLDTQPVHERMNGFGGDLSFAWSGLNVRLEALYSPDMTAVTKITDADINSAMNTLLAGEASSVRVQATEHRRFVSYSAGFDYNLWGDYGNVYVEWMQARYLDDGGVEPLLMTDILVFRAEDSYFDRSVNVFAGSMIRTKDSGPGVALTGEAEYDFKTGLTAALGTYRFIANDDEYIGMLDEMDMVYLRMKYLF